MEILHKPYYKIGEAAELVGVEPYVLRYWEREFKGRLRPEKTRSNQRLYRPKDIEAALEIKALLRDEGFRIDGARRFLAKPEVAREKKAHVAARTVEKRAEAAAASHLLRLQKALKKEIAALDKIVDDDERL